MKQYQFQLLFIHFKGILVIICQIFIFQKVFAKEIISILKIHM